MFKFKVPIANGELEFDARSLEEIYLLLNKLGALGDKELFSKMEDIDRLDIPAICPVDGMPVKLQMREATSGEGRKFITHEVISTGAHRFRLGLGVFSEPEPGKDLFVKEQEGWVYWDADKREARTVFQYGRIIYKNLPEGFEVPEEQAALYPAGEYVPKGESRPQSSTPRPQAQRTEAGSSVDPAVQRKAKAQVYLIDLAMKVNIPKAQAFKAYATHLMDDNITGNAALDVQHAEEVYNTIKSGSEADFLEVLKAAHEFATGDGDFDAEEGMPF